MRSFSICDNQVKTKTKNLFVCKIKLYGGHPYIGNCIECVSRNQNNPQHAAELAARAERSHPSTAKRVSGCCDSARNYI
jgi:hypothetical protein